MWRFFGGMVAIFEFFEQVVIDVSAEFLYGDAEIWSGGECGQGPVLQADVREDEGGRGLVVFGG